MSLHLSDATLAYPYDDSRLTALDNVRLHGGGMGHRRDRAIWLRQIEPPGRRGHPGSSPTAERSAIDGICTASKSRDELTKLRRNRRRVGILFQQPNPLASLTALE